MTIKRIVLALMLAPVSVNVHAAALAPAGVAACSSCHPGSGIGADGTLLPSLTGRSASDIVAAMEAFRSGKRPATVMDRIAKGFTAEETSAIAAWYAAQH
jgi:cytochrome subunit of sulfide dehydrogenase